jgi:hypothetical protein
MKLLYPTVSLAIILSVIISCRHSADLSVAPPKPAPPGPEFKCSHDTIFFQNTVFPLILTGCARTGCHDQATGQGDHVLDNYAGIYSLVSPFDPQSSKLYIVLYANSSETMPPGTKFTNEQKSIIYWWIAQGGYNNRCDSSGCDTSNVTYTNGIGQITQAWCVGCHGGSKPANNLRLETYDEVAACAKGDRLMGALRHQTGFKPMPNGGGTLPPCEIDMFQIWIDAGEPL